MKAIHYILIGIIVFLCSANSFSKTVSKVYSNGCKYVGEWKNGEIHGQNTDLPSKVQIKVDTVNFNMILVKAGTFMMGASDSIIRKMDKDARYTGAYNSGTILHEVTISQDYYIGETEVTQELWLAVMGEPVKTSYGNTWDFNGIGSTYPAYYVNWYDANIFIDKLNSMTNVVFRLPTEAEWEYAARGGKNSKGFLYSGSDDINTVAWYMDNSPKTNVGGYKNQVVKTKCPNELGIYDMTGNIWEWCSDFYSKSYYRESLSVDPQGSEKGNEHVIRGGSVGSDNTHCYIPYRKGVNPRIGHCSSGFRLVMTILR